MAICYHITSHGLGHCVRSITVINRIPAEIPVVICTTVAPTFLEQELRREVNIHPVHSDCGTIQPDGFTVDAARTFEAYSHIHRENHRKMKQEVDFHRRHQARVIVADAPSFPMRLAKELEIPGVVHSNFTWACIYEEHVPAYPRFKAVFAEMIEEYSLATHCLKLPFATSMACVPNHQQIGLVCRSGRDRREELAAAYGLDVYKRWVLVYIGQWPSDFDWSRLASRDDTCQLVLGSSAPEGAPVIRIDPRRFSGEHVVASCDAVVAKPGYGIVSDCVGNGVPLLYTSRVGFAEYPALERELSEWTKGFKLEPAHFFRGDLVTPLRQAYSARGSTNISLDGAGRAAEILSSLWRENRGRSPFV